MSLAYEPRTAESTGWYSWGTLVIGNTRLPLRALVLIGGATLWLGTMLVRTGGDGFRALWAHALVLGILVAIGSLSRTISLGDVMIVLFVGGALMGVMYLLGVFLIEPLLGFSRPRDFVVPATEQALYLVPLVALLWMGRGGRTLSLGATDLLLLGAAVGVGFGVVEEAYLYTRASDYIAWMPTVFVGPERLAASHALWAALGGATIGLGLLLRSRGPIWLAVAASGSLIAALDHIANNYTKWSDDLSSLLDLLTLNGWLVVGLFLGVTVACVVADRYVYSLLPTEHRPTLVGNFGWLERWGFVLWSRAVSLAWFQVQRDATLSEESEPAAGTAQRDPDETPLVNEEDADG